MKGRGLFLWLIDGFFIVYFLIEMVVANVIVSLQGIIRGWLHLRQLPSFLTPLQVILVFQGFWYSLFKICFFTWYSLLIFSLFDLCRYWNYLRKQTFVLESYISKVNWIMNRALFSSHCYLSWGFVAPYLMAVIHIAAALRVASKEYSPEETTFASGGEHTAFLF